MFEGSNEKSSAMACSLRNVPFLSYLVNDPARFWRPFGLAALLSVVPLLQLSSLSLSSELGKTATVVIVAPFHAGRVTPAPRGGGKGGQSVFFEAAASSPDQRIFPAR